MIGSVHAGLPILSGRLARGRHGGLAVGGSGERPDHHRRTVRRARGGTRQGPVGARHGYEDERWTLPRVQTLICRHLRVSLSVATVWRLLKRHGWSWQARTRRRDRPRPPVPQRAP
ncbi:winged helix-turn-helix domain-containing protein [Streptomyces yangpuensis]|uniref:helix-turn-helix domain-containing protein n=1 Tax=Streptomyces yangpuensis TaxID=1648182 RepID=UPI00364E4DEC